MFDLVSPWESSGIRIRRASPNPTTSVGLEDYGFSADIWSLGLCVYELASGGGSVQTSWCHGGNFLPFFGLPGLDDVGFVMFFVFLLFCCCLALYSCFFRYPVFCQGMCFFLTFSGVAWVGGCFFVFLFSYVFVV